MGKKNRTKRRSKKLAAEKRSLKPDDYFRQGPIEMARFGNFTVGRSNMSKEQFELMQDKLVARFPEVCREIDAKVSKIVEIVKKLPPKELLKRAYWEMAMRYIDKKSEVESDLDDSVSLRMLDYIQSIIASAQPDEAIETAVTEQQWQELRALVGDLFSQLNFDFQICLTAFNRRLPDYNQDFAEFYFKAQVYWCNVRGRRYLFHEIPFFRDVLSPHNEILKELYGISAEEFLDALLKIQNSLTLGIGKIAEDMHQFREVTLSKLEDVGDIWDCPKKDNIGAVVA